MGRDRGSDSVAPGAVVRSCGVGGSGDGAIGRPGPLCATLKGMETSQSYTITELRRDFRIVWAGYNP